MTIDYAAANALAGSAVYVVEDDRAVRDSLELLLRLRGFMPKGFASGEEFLQFTALQRPACALLDVRLPGVDGLELQRQLRQKHPGLPTIVITAHG
ncbi:MAG TPA: response regulator, partial [Burkholderiaceae bacterium]|nr:response regulator [Burkholderiaceae bacterium]